MKNTQVKYGIGILMNLVNTTQQQKHLQCLWMVMDMLIIWILSFPIG